MSDYRMSEKFGLGWKDADYERMLGFLTIMDETDKRDARASGAAPAPQGKFRPRL